MLATEDVAASGGFWTRAGFDVETYDEGSRPRIAMASNCISPPHPPMAVTAARPTCTPATFDALHATWQAAGLDVSEVADQPCGMREFSVLDPGGNRVRIGRNS